ncbi:uncharacterized protein LOC116254094 [Nymphaea colorata]|uniref:uncharacterized protein LOC116254094 n=1 Tax=Nymphaea colorata TaxID=210225 RepID=UPI00129ECCA4|nr:uncharacterized protein LOC116254094 [Nymphaea colorata]XP_031485036.1 uncharacterized protein LOC116254094 [Nymphaea colorata]XP_031485037.1 uncharacterized protein LOC116254094 [Nymphaea colorata]XP_031485039.1 uncharacterized protein LOC116254094 [Nymphaea colorata]XP_031485040.1 uncharacterized protein LOC116254094 [Nymphaea colorata]
MVDPKEQPTKKRRLLVCSIGQTNKEMVPQSGSPDQAMEMDTDEQEQQTESPTVEDPTFWTMCDKCGVRYKYYMIVMDKQLRCRHCKQNFAAKNIPLTMNVGRGHSIVVTPATQPGKISTTGQVSPSTQNGNISKIGCMSLVPLSKNDFNSNSKDSLDCQKTQLQEADKLGNGTESDNSKTRMPLASEESVEQMSNSKQLVGKLEAAHDELFKQGLRMMMKGFFIRACVANAEDLGDLLFYGRIIVRNFDDLGITDPGLGALLENLEKQAADVISQQSLASNWTSAHELFLNFMNAAECETSEAMALKASIDEEVGTYTMQVEEAEASLAEAREREEMAKRARIKAEEDLARKKEQLIMGERSREKAKHACEAKEDALAKAKEKVNKAKEELEVSMEALKEKDAKWRSLCEPLPGVMDFAL